MNKGTKISVSFPPQPEPQRLYKRILKSRPEDEKLAEHARGLLQKALDCTCAVAKKGKK